MLESRGTIFGFGNARRFAVLAALLLGGFLALTIHGYARQSDVPQPKIASPTFLVRAPKAVLRLEIANTEAERELGLMNRTHLEPHTGMLFVFPGDQPLSFWMKNTLIPLDMVFVAADGKVRQVIANVPTVAPSLPDNEIPLEQSSGKYAIELAAGEAAKDGIVPGVRLKNILSAPPAR